MKEIDPKTGTRAAAFEMWVGAPMPMVTLFKTLDVSRIERISRKRGMKFNMLMCYCIGIAASGVEEFFSLPVGKKFLQYDKLGSLSHCCKQPRRDKLLRGAVLG